MIIKKKYDTTLKVLFDEHLTEWVAFLCEHTGSPFGPATQLVTDLSTTLEADRLVRVEAESPYLLHIEIQSSASKGLPLRMLRYNINASPLGKLPVRSVVVLLRPQAKSQNLTGLYHREFAGQKYLEFRYHVINIWELPFEPLLNAGPGLMPLALITDEAAKDLPTAFGQAEEKLQDSSLDPKMRASEITHLFITMGLRYDKPTIRKLFEDAMFNLEDSVTYQDIVEKGLKKGQELGLAQGRKLGLAQGLERGRQEGREEALRENILRLGTMRFGAAPKTVMQALKAQKTSEKLQAILDRLFDATDWQSLIARKS